MQIFCTLSSPIFCIISVIPMRTGIKLLPFGPVGGLSMYVHTYKLSFKKSLLCIYTYIRNPIPGGGPRTPPLLPLPMPFLWFFHAKLLLFNIKGTDKASVKHEIGVFLGQFYWTSVHLRKGCMKYPYQYIQCFAYIPHPKATTYTFNFLNITYI